MNDEINNAEKDFDFFETIDASTVAALETRSREREMTPEQNRLLERFDSLKVGEAFFYPVPTGEKAAKLQNKISTFLKNKDKKRRVLSDKTNPNRIIVKKIA